MHQGKTDNSLNVPKQYLYIKNRMIISLCSEKQIVFTKFSLLAYPYNGL